MNYIIFIFASFLVANTVNIDKANIVARNLFNEFNDNLNRELNISSINEIEFIDMDLSSSVPWFSDILLPNEKIRQQLIEHLNKFGIGTRKFYPPIHKLTPYENIQGNFEISNEISERGLWLPSSSFLTDEQINTVCQNIKNFWN